MFTNAVRAASLLLLFDAVCPCLATLGDEPSLDIIADRCLSRANELWAGNLEVKFTRWGRTYRESGIIRSHFDYSKSAMFFQQELDDRSFTLILNNQDSFRFTKGGDIINKDSPKKLHPNVFLNPYDWRSVGIVTHGEWDQRKPLKSTLDFYHRPSHERTIEKLDNGIVSVSWRYPIGSIGKSTRRILFDGKQNFVPVHMEVALELLETGEKAASQYLEFQGDVDWQTFGADQVPSKWSYTGSSGLVGGTFEFNWLSVNNPIDEGQFSLAALQAPHGTRVINLRLEEPVVEEVIGPPTEPAPRKRWSLSLLLVINILLILAVGAVFLSRHLGKRSAGG